MKKILFILLICCFVILSVFRVNANQLTFPLIGKTIIIDPGHGGLDQGTSYRDIKEASLNLEISMHLKTELEKQGVTVKMTREGNYDLSKPNAVYRKKSDFDNRIKLINDTSNNLYLSIHLNYFTNSAYSGPQIFYSNKNPDNETLAKALQDILNDELKTNRQIKIVSNSYYLYEKLNINGVLIECGFLSNPVERNKLINSEYQKELARIITQGIINYYS